MAKKDPGTIERLNDGSVKVSITGSSSAGKQPGVTCENEDATPAKRVYTKIFTQSRIFLPDEYDEAVSTVLRNGQDVVVLGGNGYSDINEDRCQQWGIKYGAYEAACQTLFLSIYKALYHLFEGIDIRIAHGASDMGINRVLSSIATEKNIGQLGHSCPRYMFYVPDNGVPIFVGHDEADYSNRFCQSLDILVAANGAETSYKMDIDAVFKYLKYLIPLNVLAAISDNGGPPAVGPDGRVVDAVALMYDRIGWIAHQMGMTSEDGWSELVDRSQKVAISFARRLLSPQRAFLVKG